MKKTDRSVSTSVGEPIEIYCPHDSQYYYRRVERFSPQDGKLNIQYNDGGTEALDMKDGVRPQPSKTLASIEIELAPGQDLATMRKISFRATWTSLEKNSSCPMKRKD